LKKYPPKSYLDKLELYEIEAREWERNAEEIRKQAKSVTRNFYSKKNKLAKFQNENFF